MARAETPTRRPSNKPAPRGGSQRATTSPPRKRRWLRWALLLGSIPAVIVGLAMVVTFFVIFASVPLPSDLDSQATAVFDRDGNHWATLASDTSRQDVRLVDLPDHVSLSVLAAEDRGFYDHVGVAPLSIIRAAVANLAAGELAQGGSTITQQYVKNAVVGNDRTLLRKLREAAVAIKLEQAQSKDHILELYLNTIYWGRGAYGIEAAAQTYFGVTAAQLSLSQSAMLAGIIQAPEGLDPAEEPEAAERRRQFVLDGLVAMEALPRDVIEDARAQELPQTSTRSLATSGSGGYYLDAVRRELAELVGDEAVFRGLQVTVEVDPLMQAAAERILSEALTDQPFSGALVAVDPEDGAIRALVGGPDVATQPFNAAVLSRRQPGSAFKPFTLAAWVDAGFSPESRYLAPAQVTVPDGTGGTTEIRNYGDRDRGTQTVREATWTSTNTVYVRMQEEVGADAVVDMAYRLGIPEERDLQAVPSLTLGVAGVNAVDMASAYATLAAGGVRSEPRLVRRVLDADGAVLYEAAAERTPVMSAGDAFLVGDVLRGVVANGTGARAALADRPAAGKTGTTNDFRDAWFVGYVPQLATAVWVGNLDNSPMDGVTGGSVPAEIWAAFMAEATAGMDVRDLPAADARGKQVVNGANPAPDEEPTDEPTDGATDGPSDQPSDGSSEDPGPTDDPECTDGVLGVLPGGECEPSDEASEATSDDPSAQPSDDPSDQPSDEPSGQPTDEPTDQPTDGSTDGPSPSPDDSSEPPPTDPT